LGGIMGDLVLNSQRNAGAKPTGTQLQTKNADKDAPETPAKAKAGQAFQNGGASKPAGGSAAAPAANVARAAAGISNPPPVLSPLPPPLIATESPPSNSPTSPGASTPPVITAAKLHDDSTTNARLREIDQWASTRRTPVETINALSGVGAGFGIGVPSAAERQYLIGRVLDHEFTFLETEPRPRYVDPRHVRVVPGGEVRHDIDRAKLSYVEKLAELVEGAPSMRGATERELVDRAVKLEGDGNAKRATEAVLQLATVAKGHEAELGAMLSHLPRDKALLFAMAAAETHETFADQLPQARNLILAALNANAHAEATTSIVLNIYAVIQPGDFTEVDGLDRNIVTAMAREGHPVDGAASAKERYQSLVATKDARDFLFGGSEKRRRLALRIVQNNLITPAMLATPSEQERAIAGSAMSDMPLENPHHPLCSPAIAKLMAAELLKEEPQLAGANRDSAKLTDLLGTREGQTLIFGPSQGDTLDPDVRDISHDEALSAFLSDPSLTAADFKPGEDPWTNPRLATAMAQARFAAIRNDQPEELSGAVLQNMAGAAMGHHAVVREHPTLTIMGSGEQIPVPIEDLLSTGRLPLFDNDEGVKNVVDKIVEVGGHNPLVTIVPVMVVSPVMGAVQYPLFRVGTDGREKFVDHEGGVYTSIEDWQAHNTLPPGRVVFPKDGHIQADPAGKLLLAEAETPEARLTAGKVVDKAMFVGGIVASGVLIVGTGGGAVAAASVFFAASSVWAVGRDTYDIVGRLQHDQDIPPELWLDAATNALGVGAAAGSVARRGAKAVSLAAKATQRAAAITGAVSFGLGIKNFAENASTMTLDQLAQQGLQLGLGLLVMGKAHGATPAADRAPLVERLSKLLEEAQAGQRQATVETKAASAQPPTPTSKSADDKLNGPVGSTKGKPTERPGAPAYSVNSRWRAGKETVPQTPSGFVPPTDKPAGQKQPQANAGDVAPAAVGNKPKSEPDPTPIAMAGKKGGNGVIVKPPSEVVAETEYPAAEATLRNSFSDNPAKAKAFGNLLKDPIYKKLPASTRVAILEQIARAGDADYTEYMLQIIRASDRDPGGAADLLQLISKLADTRQSRFFSLDWEMDRAFTRLVEDPSYKKLPASSRIAVLEQVSRAAHKRGIENIQRVVENYDLGQDPRMGGERGLIQTLKLVGAASRSRSDVGKLLIKDLVQGSPEYLLVQTANGLDRKYQDLLPKDRARAPAYIQIVNNPNFTTLDISARYAVHKAISDYYGGAVGQMPPNLIPVIESLMKGSWFRQGLPVNQYLTTRRLLEIFEDSSWSAAAKKKVLDVVSSKDPGKEVDKVARSVRNDVVYRSSLPGPVGLAFDRLIENSEFHVLNPIICMDVLDQISQGTSATAIDNLEDLIERPDFQNALPEKQVELIKYTVALSNSQPSGPNR
jgi:hypothetical protein